MTLYEALVVIGLYGYVLLSVYQYLLTQKYDSYARAAAEQMKTLNAAKEEIDRQRAGLQKQSDALGEIRNDPQFHELWKRYFSDIAIERQSEKVD